MSILATADPLLSGAEQDVRDPLLRPTQLFDANNRTLLNPTGDTEVRTAAGRINDAHVIAYCTDVT